MRSAFINTLVDASRDNPNIWLLVGDLGYSVVDPFISEFPDRFLNVGIAEQNMTGVATGLALSGKTVFIYSIANFPTLRCLEQIRNDVVYHNANVKIVAVGGGFAYGTAGMTHHAIEDIAVMRSLPNLLILAPGDPVETELATKAIIEYPGPCYLRLGKAQEPIIHKQPPSFEIGKAIVARDGDDVTLISTGGTLQMSMIAAEQLQQDGINARVLSMHTIKPIDVQAIISAVNETENIITVEEHRLTGGLGSAVSETLTDLNLTQAKLKRIGIKELYNTETGGQDYLRYLHGLTSENIVATTKEILFSN